MRVTVDVAELQRVSRTNIVEADSIAEAEVKASIGDTVDEWDALQQPEVVDRTVFETRPDDD